MLPMIEFRIVLFHSFIYLIVSFEEDIDDKSLFVVVLLGMILSLSMFFSMLVVCLGGIVGYDEKDSQQ